MSKTILITGATGLLGRNMTAALLKRGDKVIALTTHLQSAKQKLAGVEKIAAMDDIMSLKNEKIDAIINLAGANVGEKRWSNEYKKVIYNSRIGTTKKIIELISLMAVKPEVLLNMSGIDYYGDTGDKTIDENSPKGSTFLSDVCSDWETEAIKASSLGVRVALMRTAFVIAKNSLAVKKLILPFKFFAGGPIGSGKQYMSWTHIDDVIGIFLFAIENPSLSGAVNVCSPEPETMKDFSRDIGKAMGRPSFFRVTSFVVKLAAGEMSEVILAGRKAFPVKLTGLGYKFKYPNAYNAWKDVLGK